jgi:hypothetical protein
VATDRVRSTSYFVADGEMLTSQFFLLAIWHKTGVKLLKSGAAASLLAN